jgi:colicin import membrane protein
VLPSPFKL